MNFNSFSFVVFLAFVMILRAAVPWTVGRWLMVAASYFFYGVATPWYCLLLLTSTLVDFMVSLHIPLTSKPQAKRGWLLLSIIVNLALLGTFKYGDFTVNNINTLLGLIGLNAMPLPGFLLPIGISFYTFQTLSYTIDVYRGKVAPTRDFGAFALYVAFFPQLVAGPIERAGSLLPQLKEKQTPSVRDFELGFQRMLIGFVKKVVLADRLAVMVDEVYASPGDASSPVLLLAAFSFSIQIYMDFSAYADIAIGIARMMGVRLRENFDAPFLETNLSGFWAHWHMSLTSWLADYVYRPMLRWFSSRTSRLFFCPMTVMTLVGLWHGANWNFVYFGMLNGLGIVVYHAMQRATGRRFGLFGRSRWSSLLAVFVTHSYVTITAVFFRAPNLETAWTVLHGMISGSWIWNDRYTPYLAFFLFLWASVIVWEKMIRPRGRIATPGPVRGAFWFFLVGLILYSAVDNTERFIYFQF